jgi:DNA recombination protein RmuC
MIGIYILLVVSILLIIISLVVSFMAKKQTLSDGDKAAINSSFSSSVNILATSLSESQKANSAITTHTISALSDNLSASVAALEKRVLEIVAQLDQRMQQMSRTQEEKLEAIRQSNERNIKNLQEDNTKQLDKMRETVDEKLSKTINDRFNETFEVLSTQLEKVHKSLGEMQSIATDVGSLTKVLSNVKTTGIFGEVQLGAILDSMLNREQYDTNVITGEGKEPVEYAIKFPGQADGEFVYLPIDSKFPYTVYSDLQTAYDNNDIDGIKQKKEQLKTTIRGMAKDIYSKYICPPRTTDFAVMFLPIEGLYAEVVKMGLTEELQSKYKVTIAGPTTMSALLNSFQMGFRTLAIQKKSGEVWKILGAVRTEFDKFNEIIEKIQGKLDSTSKDFDNLIGTRSRMIASKLRSVERVDSAQSGNILGIADNTLVDPQGGKPE